MELFIENEIKKDLSPFCEWLIEEIRKIIISNLRVSSLNIFNNYLKQVPVLQFIDGIRPINVKHIFLTGLYNLTYNRRGDNYVIFIDPNVKLPNTNNRLIDLMRFITYGNSTIKGYPILNKEFNKIADNLEYFYKKYLKTQEGFTWIKDS